MIVFIGKYKNWKTWYRYLEKIPFLYNFLNNQVKIIKIDNHDAWNIDHTLAPIILALLKKFKKDVNGWPSELNSFEDWTLILDQMIWSFQELSTDDWENQFYHESPKWFDKQGYEKHQEKIQEGINLFAKYYCALWW